MRILVVDDSRAVRDSVCALLHLHGHTAVEAATYTDALEVVRTQAVDVVLSDVTYPRTPGGDEAACGFELATDCQALEIPVALMSGRPIDVWQHPEVLMVPTLKKPFRIEQLLGVLGRLIRRETVRESPAELPEPDQDPEPEIDDTVRCCPDCERPNQFGEVCPACLSRRQVLSRLMDYVRPYKGKAILGLTLAVLVTTAGLAHAVNEEGALEE